MLENRKEGVEVKSILLRIVGTISLGLGVLGIILPVLPTTPFLLLSFTCYMRSNSKSYKFILSNKYLAPYVKDYISGNGIPVKVKKKAIIMIWITIGFSIIFVIEKIFLKLMLLMVAIIVSTYIWTRNAPEGKVS